VVFILGNVHELMNTKHGVEEAEQHTARMNLLQVSLYYMCVYMYIFVMYIFVIYTYMGWRKLSIALLA